MGQFHLISRRPRCRPCANCKRLQLLGIDEGLPFRVEPLPLTVGAEIAALMVGRVTYGIHVGYVCHRTEGRIGLDKFNGRPPVVATHKCQIIVNAADVEYGHVDAMSRIIERASATKEEDKDDDAELDALFSLRDLLSGGVVAELEPPF